MKEKENTLAGRQHYNTQLHINKKKSRGRKKLREMVSIGK
jgi:hypothetical protein